MAASARAFHTKRLRTEEERVKVGYSDAGVGWVWHPPQGTRVGQRNEPSMIRDPGGEPRRGASYGLGQGLYSWRALAVDWHDSRWAGCRRPPAPSPGAPAGGQSM